MTAPPFLGDLYRDLRDRRLLPVVIGLGVAILAVPVLLKSSPEAPPPVPANSVAAEDVAPPPAVFVGEEGVRKYQKRLDHLRSKNPFEAKFTAPAVGDDVSLSDVSDSGSDGSTTVTIDDPSSTSSSDGGSSSSSDSTGGSDSSSSSSDSSSSSGGSTDSEGESELVFFAYRADLDIGPKGKLKSRDNLKELTVLPGSANPVVIFLGVTQDGKHAAFQVSSDVTATSGDGSCLPGAANCDYLTLEPGDRRELTYHPDGENAVTYVLKLKDIDIVQVEDPRKNAKKASSKQARRATEDSGGANFHARGG